MLAATSCAPDLKYLGKPRPLNNVTGTETRRFVTASQINPQANLYGR